MFLQDSISEEDLISVDRVMLAPLPHNSRTPQYVTIESESVVPPQTAATSYTPASHFSDLDRDMVLSEISAESHSVTTVAKQNNISRSNIHYWAKQSGMEMPSKKLKRDIIEECSSGAVAPAVLAKTHGRDIETIRGWVKKDGKKLPGKYFKQSTTAATQSNSTVIYLRLSTKKYFRDILNKYFSIMKINGPPFKP